MPEQIQDQQSHRDDRGETLVEILVALVIMGITVASILGAFTTAITDSAHHRTLVVLNSMLRNYAEAYTSQIQFQQSPLFTSCASSYTISGLTAPPTGYTISGQGSAANPTIQYWNGSAWVAVGSCSSTTVHAQQITLSATGLYGQSQTLSFVVSDPGYTATNVAPAFTSAASTSAATGTAFSFTVTAIGSPVPAITNTALPAGVTFTDLGNGTGTLSGTTAVAGGTYSINFTASNSVGSPAVQAFTLTVATPPVFTTPASSPASTTFAGASAKKGTLGTYTFAATGSPTPHFTYSGTLSPDMTFVDNNNGTATVSGTMKSADLGTWVITVTANSGSFNVSVTFTITVTS